MTRTAVLGAFGSRPGVTVRPARKTPISPYMNAPRTNQGPQQPPLPTYEPLVSIRELAAWIGVSEHAVKKWCSRGPETGLVPKMLRINGQIRFRPTDIRTWLETKEIR